MKQSLLRALRSVWTRSKWDGEDPIRAELFSVERLEQHAESLAAAQRVTARPTRGARSRDAPARQRPRPARRVSPIGAAIREERAITPAAEWLVDNFHVVEEQIREIRDDLPRGFYRAAAEARGRAARRATRASSAWPGPSSRTPTAASIPRRCCASCAPTSACSRSRSASSGPSRSRCASCWSRTCGARPSGSCSSRAARQEADALADRLLGDRSRDEPSRRRRRCGASSDRRCRAASPCSWSSGCATRIPP